MGAVCLPTWPKIITCHGLREIGLLICGFFHPKKASERNFFHSFSRNPWQVIISGPVDMQIKIFNAQGRDGNGNDRKNFTASVAGNGNGKLARTISHWRQGQLV